MFQTETRSTQRTATVHTYSVSVAVLAHARVVLCRLLIGVTLCQLQINISKAP
jgi:hypothetical protein